MTSFKRQIRTPFETLKSLSPLPFLECAAALPLFSVIWVPFSNHLRRREGTPMSSRWYVETVRLPDVGEATWTVAAEGERARRWGRRVRVSGNSLELG
ncbi:hypothetical protein ERO13_D02G173800v2 [Gossypium hirsutum]|uniref:Uncharacterized protein n=1 Tax=Gossypium tomentosum TaxID=34277 RepID=A0A5D2M0G9_GOSTO|nr:hypothetical protein ERO13_D02G173800v2 [Gossypium hirsutum]TYH84772.1 hypothetical protein ES332_D02G219000v1 [Gossypium tomentosum]